MTSINVAESETRGWKTASENVSHHSINKSIETDFQNSRLDENKLFQASNEFTKAEPKSQSFQIHWQNANRCKMAS